MAHHTNQSAIIMTYRRLLGIHSPILHLLPIRQHVLVIPVFDFLVDLSGIIIDSEDGGDVIHVAWHDKCHLLLLVVGAGWWAIL